MIIATEEQIDELVKLVNNAIRTTEKVAEILESAHKQHVYTFDADDPDGNKERAERVERMIKQALTLLRG